MLSVARAAAHVVTSPDAFLLWNFPWSSRWRCMAAEISYGMFIVV